MALAEPEETRMSAQAFMRWYEQQPEGIRCELFDGRIFEMSAERLAHVRIKSRVHRQFEREIADRQLQCEAMADGMAVLVDDDSVFEPDVLVRCGSPLPGDTTLILDPLIVVEVASPSTQRIDALDKFARYFRNVLLVHYIIVVPAKRLVIHHARAGDGRIVSASHDRGALRIDPPGLDLSLAQLFDAETLVS